MSLESLSLTSLPLDGRVAVVTGGGAAPGAEFDGVGQAISILFARAGAHVFVVDLDGDRAAHTVGQITGEGGRATAIVADVGEEADCVRIVEEAVAAGRLDVLVNNVAIVPRFAPVADVSADEWDRIQTVNVRSAFLMCKYAVPRMIDGGGGSIVNIASISAAASTGLTPAYGASKAAMVRLTADVAVAYGRQGVRSNVIRPGNIDTPMASAAAATLDPELYERLVEHEKPEPMGYWGDAWDVAWAALFLASDQSRWITGACLPVDGGLAQVNPNYAAGQAAASVRDH
jgi:NAD(P)-dependent dehydrogenase (short-subunit alcohol dehydrogenase family)